MMVWGSHIGQGSAIDPKSVASRMIFFISFLLGVLFVSSYSAALMSYLTIGAVLPFTSLEGILETDYTISSVNGSAFLDMFLQAPPGSIHATIGSEIILKDAFGAPNSIEEGLKRAKEENFAFVWAADVINGKNQENCDFVDIPDVVGSGDLGIGYSKGLPHRHIFNYFINKMKETGQLKRIIRKWLPKPREDCNAAAAFISLGLENMISAFAMFTAIAVLAVVVAFFERFVFKKEVKVVKASDPINDVSAAKEGWTSSIERHD